MINKNFSNPVFKVVVCMLVFLLSVQCGKKKAQKQEQVVEENKEVAVETVLRTITDTEFAEFIVNEKPVVVIFEQKNCAACPVAVSMLEEIVAEHEDQYMVASIDASTNPAAVANYKVEVTPTIIIFKNGEEVARFTDSIEKSGIIEVLNRPNN
jgi:thioredoxin 1